MPIMKPCPNHPENGAIDLEEGCPECIAMRQALASQVNGKLAQEPEIFVLPDIVKVRYYSQTSGEASEREYTYFTEESLEVGDIIMVPVRDGTKKVVVSAVDIPDAEIESFRDKVKTISAGSKLTDQSKVYGMVDEASLEQEALSDEEEEAIMREEIGEPFEITASILADTMGPEYHAIGEVINLAMPSRDSAVLALVVEANRFLQYAGERVVNDVISEKKAGEDLILIRTTRKAIEAKRKEYLDPVNTLAADIREFFKQLTDPIELADKMTSGQILSYGVEVTRQREEAERIERAAYQLAREQEALTGEHTVSLAEVTKPEPEKKRVRSDVGVTSKVDQWKWKVIDPDAIPREYLIPDEAMLNSIAKKHHDKKLVPGVLFFNEPHLATRSS